MKTEPQNSLRRGSDQQCIPVASGLPSDQRADVVEDFDLVLVYPTKMVNGGALGDKTNLLPQRG